MNDKCAKYVNFMIKATVIICASSGFSETLEKFNPELRLDRADSEYAAVTVQDGRNYIVLFKEPISINTIAHESQHIADFEKLTGEQAASLVGKYTDLFIRTLVLEEAKVYYSMPKKDHYLTKN